MASASSVGNVSLNFSATVGNGVPLTYSTSPMSFGGAAAGVGKGSGGEGGGGGGGSPFQGQHFQTLLTDHQRLGPQRVSNNSKSPSNAPIGGADMGMVRDGNLYGNHLKNGAINDVFDPRHKEWDNSSSNVR